MFDLFTLVIEPFLPHSFLYLCVHFSVLCFPSWCFPLGLQYSACVARVQDVVGGAWLGVRDAEIENISCRFSHHFIEVVGDSLNILFLQ